MFVIKNDMNKEEYLQLAESLEVQNPDKVIETKVALEPGEVVYAEVDGSMIFTDDKWREVKVGRLFRKMIVQKALRAEAEVLIEASMLHIWVTIRNLHVVLGHNCHRMHI